MIESKFDAIACQDLDAYVLQMMFSSVFFFLKDKLYFINQTYKIALSSYLADEVNEC